MDRLITQEFQTITSSMELINSVWEYGLAALERDIQEMYQLQNRIMLHEVFWSMMDIESNLLGGLPLILNVEEEE